MRSPRILQRSAFSALQLVVVLALLLMAMAMAIPVITRIREAAARTQSINNLKQLALAMHSYHDVNKSFPPTVGPSANLNGSAHFHILPFIEQNAAGDVWKNGAWSKVIPAFLDPRDPSLPNHVYKNWLAATNYPVNWMVCKDGKMRFAAITDGTTNTLMFAQRMQMCNGQPTAWGYPSIYTWAPMFGYYSEGMFQSAPAQEICDPALPQSIGRDMLAAFCDGHVQTIGPDIRPSTWYYLTDPTDGNPLPPEDGF